MLKYFILLYTLQPVLSKPVKCYNCTFCKTVTSKTQTIKCDVNTCSTISWRNGSVLSLRRGCGRTNVMNKEDLDRAEDDCKYLENMRIAGGGQQAYSECAFCSRNLCNNKTIDEMTLPKFVSEYKLEVDFFINDRNLVNENNNGVVFIRKLLFYEIFYIVMIFNLIYL